MLYKPAYESMMIRLFGRSPLFILFLEPNETLSFLYSKTLV
jgi:hypothetical protein